MNAVAAATVGDVVQLDEVHSLLHTAEDTLRDFLPDITKFTVIVLFSVALAYAANVGIEWLIRQAHVKRHWATLWGYVVGGTVFLFGIGIAFGAVGLTFWQVSVTYGFVAIAFGRGFGDVIGNAAAGIVLQLHDLFKSHHDITLSYYGTEYRGTVVATNLQHVEIRPYDTVPRSPTATTIGSSRSPSMPRGGIDESGREYADETIFLPNSLVVSLPLRARWRYERGSAHTMMPPHTLEHVAAPAPQLLPIPDAQTKARFANSSHAFGAFAASDAASRIAAAAKLLRHSPSNDSVGGIQQRHNTGTTHHRDMTRPLWRPPADDDVDSDDGTSAAAELLKMI